LLRGCQNGTVTGDLSLSTCELTPAGCAVTDSCEDRSSCASCYEYDGPGASGMYWDPALSEDSSRFWSSSSLATNTSYAWHVYFDSSYVIYSYKPDGRHVRCVRAGP
jgi:hypothetical protein